MKKGFIMVLKCFGFKWHTSTYNVGTLKKQIDRRVIGLHDLSRDQFRPNDTLRQAKFLLHKFDGKNLLHDLRGFEMTISMKENHGNGICNQIVTGLCIRTVFFPLKHCKRLRLVVYSGYTGSPTQNMYWPPSYE